MQPVSTAAFPPVFKAALKRSCAFVLAGLIVAGVAAAGPAAYAEGRSNPGRPEDGGASGRKATPAEPAQPSDGGTASPGRKKAPAEPRGGERPPPMDEGCPLRDPSRLELIV